ncbi:MAG: hypothetical protein ACU836_16945 [Gammaproteobacteria bacterium]
MTNDHEEVYSGLDIYVGEQAAEFLRLHLPELKRLIKMESDATYHAPNILFWQLRGRLHDFLRPLLERIGLLSSKRRRKFGERLLRRLYPSIWFDRWTLQQEREWAWKDALKLLQQSQLTVVLLDDHVAGVSGYKLGGKTDDGREIFEITKTCILPRYRKLGIHQSLRDAVVRSIRQRHGGSPPIMSFTRNPSVIRRCEFLKWKNISIEEYGALISRVGRTGLPEELISEFIRHNWHAFMYDPLWEEGHDN